MTESVVVISLLTKLSLDKVISEIFKLGYGVIPANEKYLVAEDNSPAAVLALKITSPPIDPSALIVIIGTTLSSNNIKYYSVVMFRENTVSWLGSNFSLKDIKKAKTNPPYLKLIKKPSKEEPESLI